MGDGYGLGEITEGARKEGSQTKRRVLEKVGKVENGGCEMWLRRESDG